MSQRVCLVSVFYGKLPFWLPAFFLSCKYNQDIDWLFVSDHKPELEMPPNVKFLEMILDELNDRICGVFNKDVGVDRRFPYKLCDFKPFYGMIFSDYINDYDYWGHCDLDIVWGNISSFLLQENFFNYDIFTTRPNQISGHFCLYKNTPRVSQYLYNLPGLIGLLEMRYDYKGIDEKYISRCLRNDLKPGFLRKIKKIFYRKIEAGPVVYWQKYLATAGYHQREMLKTELSFSWKCGKTYHIDGTEMMYIHFHKLKQTMSEIDFDSTDDLSEMIINGKGFFAIS